MKKANITENKKTARRVDKTLVIAISVCVAIALLVIGILVIPERFEAVKQMNDIKKFVTDTENLTVVINASQEYTGIMNDKEEILRDADAKTFVAKISDVLKNVEYSDTTKISTGVWKTKIVLYNDNSDRIIYIDNENIYIENNGRLIAYTVKESGKENFSALLDMINKGLNN